MKNQGGFTLLELILVMVIIGILAGAVVLNVTGRATDAKIARAKSDIAVYSSAVKTYAVENNDVFPKRLLDLSTGKRKYVDVVKKDPWNREYVYNPKGKRAEFEIYSLGADGKAGTPDDITNWSDNE